MGKEMNFKIADYATDTSHSLDDKDIQLQIKKHCKEFFSWVYKVIATVPIQEPDVELWKEKAPLPLRQLVYGVFNDDIPRSSLVDTIIKHPECSPAIPPILYSYREKWKYEDWNKNRALKIALGKYFHDYYEGFLATGKRLPWIGVDSVPSTREIILAHNFKDSRYSKPDQNGFFIKKVEGAKEWNAIPGNYRRVLWQTWVFSPKHRIPGMLLDFNDWDNVPSPLFKDDLW